ncbi:MAG: hypothetical protein OXF88_18325 [Rhodobacteraceae bacterium]|nr:hypothetical protein [Paracoccaceae bacterium]MCY4140447.1 hypothetical protein [Paracoccaceae bacterium]
MEIDRPSSPKRISRYEYFEILIRVRESVERLRRDTWRLAHHD